MKKKQKPKDETKIRLGIVRDSMKAQGAYDGRFNSKVYETKKRKSKYLSKHHLEKNLDDLIQNEENYL